MIACCGFSASICSMRGKNAAVQIPLDALATLSAQIAAPGIQEPGPAMGGIRCRLRFCAARAGPDQPARPAIAGLNIAVLSTVPSGAGVSSSASLEVATMMNLRDHFALLKPAAAAPCESPTAPPSIR